MPRASLGFSPPANSVSAGVPNHSFRALCLHPEPLKSSGELCKKPYRVTQIQSPLGKPSHGIFLKVSERVLTGFEIYTLKRQETSSSSLTCRIYTPCTGIAHYTHYILYTPHGMRTPYVHDTSCAQTHTTEPVLTPHPAGMSC